MFSALALTFCRLCRFNNQSKSKTRRMVVKKTVARIGAVALVMAVVISSVGLAMAQGNGEEGQSDVKVLAVRVPGVVQVNEPVTIAVTDREDGSPVPAASVYALRWPYPGVSDVAGPRYGCEFLGKTDNAGEVVHAFDKVGGVLIVATKEGWGPGLARLKVKPNLTGRLAVEAPRRAEVNDPVTIGVHEKNSGDAVAEADVWAVDLPGWTSVDGIRTPGHTEGLLEELREGGNITDLLDSRGMYLDQTNVDGELEYAFSEIGWYVLVATKSGYAPGCRLTTIVPDKAIVLQAEPKRPDVGEDVTFTAKTRGTGSPVEGVALYAVGAPFADFLPASVAAITGGTESLEQWAAGHGFYIGTTNGNGQFVCAFEEDGAYLIVGVKDGYAPGFAFVRVGQWSEPGQLLPQLKKSGEELGRSGPALESRRLQGLSLLERVLPAMKATGLQLHAGPLQQQND